MSALSETVAIFERYMKLIANFEIGLPIQWRNSSLK